MQPRDQEQPKEWESNRNKLFSAKFFEAPPPQQTDEIKFNFPLPTGATETDLQFNSPEDQKAFTAGLASLTQRLKTWMAQPGTEFGNDDVAAVDKLIELFQSKKYDPQSQYVLATKGIPMLANVLHLLGNTTVDQNRKITCIKNLLPELVVSGPEVHTHIHNTYIALLKEIKINFPLPTGATGTDLQFNSDKDQNDKDHKSFIAGLESLTQRLKTWIAQQGTEFSKPDIAAVDKLIELFQSKKYGSRSQYVLATEGIPMLAKVLHLLGDPTVDQNRKITCIKNLLPGLAVCGPGVHTHIYDTYIALLANPATEFMMWRKKAAETICKLEYMPALGIDINPAMEIHYVNAFLNSASAMIGIHPINDFYKVGTNIDIFEKCMVKIAQVLSPIELIQYILEGKGSFQVLLNKTPEELEKTSIEDYDEVEKWLVQFGEDETFKLKNLVYDAIEDEYRWPSAVPYYFILTLFKRLMNSKWIDESAIKVIEHVSLPEFQIEIHMPEQGYQCAFVVTNEAGITSIKPFICYYMDVLLASGEVSPIRDLIPKNQVSQFDTEILKYITDGAKSFLANDETETRKKHDFIAHLVSGKGSEAMPQIINIISFLKPIDAEHIALRRLFANEIKKHVLSTHSSEIVLNYLSLLPLGEWFDIIADSDWLREAINFQKLTDILSNLAIQISLNDVGFIDLNLMKQLSHRSVEGLGVLEKVVDGNHFGPFIKEHPHAFKILLCHAVISKNLFQLMQFLTSIKREDLLQQSVWDRVSPHIIQDASLYESLRKLTVLSEKEIVSQDVFVLIFECIGRNQRDKAWLDKFIKVVDCLPRLAQMEGSTLSLSQGNLKLLLRSPIPMDELNEMINRFEPASDKELKFLTTQVANAKLIVQFMRLFSAGGKLPPEIKNIILEKTNKLKVLVPLLDVFTLTTDKYIEILEKILTTDFDVIKELSTTLSNIKRQYQFSLPLEYLSFLIERTSEKDGLATLIPILSGCAKHSVKLSPSHMLALTQHQNLDPDAEKASKLLDDALKMIEQLQNLNLWDINIFSVATVPDYANLWRLYSSLQKTPTIAKELHFLINHVFVAKARYGNNYLEIAARFSHLISSNGHMDSNLDFIQAIEKHLPRIIDTNLINAIEERLKKGKNHIPFKTLIEIITEPDELFNTIINTAIQLQKTDYRLHQAFAESSPRTLIALSQNNSEVFKLLRSRNHSSDVPYTFTFITQLEQEYKDIHFSLEAIKEIFLIESGKPEFKEFFALLKMMKLTDDEELRFFIRHATLSAKLHNYASKMLKTDHSNFQDVKTKILKDPIAIGALIDIFYKLEIDASEKYFYLSMLSNVPAETLKKLAAAMNKVKIIVRKGSTTLELLTFLFDHIDNAETILEIKKRLSWIDITQARDKHIILSLAKSISLEPDNTKHQELIEHATEMVSKLVRLGSREFELTDEMIENLSASDYANLYYIQQFIPFVDRHMQPTDEKSLVLNLLKPDKRYYLEIAKKTIHYLYQHLPNLSTQYVLESILHTKPPYGIFVTLCEYAKQFPEVLERNEFHLLIRHWADHQQLVKVLVHAHKQKLTVKYASTSLLKLLMSYDSLPNMDESQKLKVLDNVINMLANLEKIFGSIKEPIYQSFTITDLNIFWEICGAISISGKRSEKVLEQLITLGFKQGFDLAGVLNYITDFRTNYNMVFDEDTMLTIFKNPNAFSHVKAVYDGLGTMRGEFSSPQWFTAICQSASLHTASDILQILKSLSSIKQSDHAHIYFVTLAKSLKSTENFTETLDAKVEAYQALTKIPVISPELMHQLVQALLMSIGSDKNFEPFYKKISQDKLIIDKRIAVLIKLLSDNAKLNACVMSLKHLDYSCELIVDETLISNNHPLTLTNINFVLDVYDKSKSQYNDHKIIKENTFLAAEFLTIYYKLMKDNPPKDPQLIIDQLVKLYIKLIDYGKHIVHALYEIDALKDKQIKSMLAAPDTLLFIVSHPRKIEDVVAILIRISGQNNLELLSQIKSIIEIAGTKHPDSPAIIRTHVDAICITSEILKVKLDRDIWAKLLAPLTKPEVLNAKHWALFASLSCYLAITSQFSLGKLFGKIGSTATSKSAEEEQMVARKLLQYLSGQPNMNFDQKEILLLKRKPLSDLLQLDPGFDLNAIPQSKPKLGLSNASGLG